MCLGVSGKTAKQADAEKKQAAEDVGTTLFGKDVVGKAGENYQHGKSGQDSQPHKGHGKRLDKHRR